jgi:hypothetical protein
VNWAVVVRGADGAEANEGARKARGAGVDVVGGA